MTELKEKIKNLIEIQYSPISLEDIEFVLNIPQKEQQSIMDAINELEAEGSILEVDQQEYTPFPKNSNLFVGQLRYNSQQRPFILVNNNLIYIPQENLAGALKGDIVLVKKNAYNQLGDNISIVQKILKRQQNYLMFECTSKDNQKQIRPYQIPFPCPVQLSKEEMDHLSIGDRFLVELENNAKNGIFKGKIASFVGHQNDPYLDVKTIAASHNIRIEFPKEVMEEVENIPTQIGQEELERELASGRIDLRDKTIFTIDGKDTKDMDDAISIEINEKGNYVLGVHIADVSYYVKEGSNLQKEALKRAHSYYFLNLVFPMLPKRLSTGICSLNPNTDRFCKSCEMEISKEGELLSHRIFNSVIRSRKKMTYEDVNTILDNHKMVDGYEEYVQDLKEMYELSHILDLKKHQRGYITFGTGEMKIHTNEQGFPTNISMHYKGSANKLIENFMLLANETIGNYPEDLDLEKENLPYIYRIHELPKSDRIHEVIRYLIQSGYPIPNKEYKDPKEFQELVESISDLSAYPVLSEMLIRGLSKAKYSIDNIGHFGLALPHYTHFTSPIRRYSDLQTHYNMNKYNSEIRQSLNPIEERQKMIEICKHTTEAEKIADIADQEITAYKLAQYMEDKVGKRFHSIITFIGKNNVIIKTEDYVTGTIPTSELLEMGYQLVDGATLVHKDTGQKLRIGDFIAVTLQEVNLETRKIHFSVYANNHLKQIQKVI